MSYKYSETKRIYNEYYRKEHREKFNEICKKSSLQYYYRNQDICSKKKLEYYYWKKENSYDWISKIFRKILINGF